MNAITYHEYGAPDVLELQEIDTPAPSDDQVLVRVMAASVNPANWHLVRGAPYVMRLAGSGLRKPKNHSLGSDIAGQVESVGQNVTRFRPGDEVFGFVGKGGFAEYTCASEGLLSQKPSSLTYEQAAAVPLAAMTAL